MWHIGCSLDGYECQCRAPPHAPQVQKCWQDHCSQMLTIRRIFLYLDRSYVINTSGVRSLFEMGLQLFRAHLGHHAEVTLPADARSLMQTAQLHQTCGG